MNTILLIQEHALENLEMAITGLDDKLSISKVTYDTESDQIEVDIHYNYPADLFYLGMEYMNTQCKFCKSV